MIKELFSIPFENNSHKLYFLQFCILVMILYNGCVYVKYLSSIFFPQPNKMCQKEILSKTSLFAKEKKVKKIYKCQENCQME